MLAFQGVPGTVVTEHFQRVHSLSMCMQALVCMVFGCASRLLLLELVFIVAA